MTDVIVAEQVTAEAVMVEVVELALQGPPGPQGNHGFTTSVDVISGGTPFTDYTNGFIFSGGTP